MRRTSFARDVHRHSVIMVGVLTLICAATYAVGRDALLLPPPTTSSMLDRYADYLGLGEAQRSAWRRAHLDYQADHRRQRTNFIDQLQPLRRQIGEPPFDAADPGDVRRYYAIHQQAMEQLLALDRALFDALKPHLTDEQAERLPAVLARRTSDAWQATEILQRWWRHELHNFHGSRVNLDDVLVDADIDGAARRELNAIIDQHTIRFEHALRELYRQSANLHRDWARRVMEVAAGEEPSMRERAEPYIDLAAPARLAYQRLMEQQHEALLSILNAADAETSWRIFVTVNKAHTDFILTPPIRRFDRLTDQLRDLDPDDADADRFDQYIAECCDAFKRAFDAASRFAIEQNSDYPPGIGPGIDARREMTDSVRDFMTPAKTCVEALIPDVRDDEALVGAIEGVFADRAAQQAAPDAEALSNRIQEQFREDLTPDDFIPGPISRDLVNRFADAFELSRDVRGVLDEIHRDYQRSFMRIRRAEIDEAPRVFVGFRFRDSGMGEFSTPEEVERKHEARLAARQAVDELDQRFISDVFAAVLDHDAKDKRWMLELLRAAEAWTRGTRRSIRMAGEYVEYRAEPLTAVLDSDVDHEERHAAIDAIKPHAHSIISALRELSEAELALEYAGNRQTATMREDDRDEAFARWQPRRDRAMAALRDARRAVVERSHAALEAIDAAVSSQTSDAVRQTYLRLAFPSIYDDEDAQHERFNAAFAIGSLGATQRDRLTDAWVEYQESYRQTSRRMVDAMRQGDLYGLVTSDEDRAALERIKNAINDLDLERQQLNDAAALAIETILTPAQREAID